MDTHTLFGKLQEHEMELKRLVDDEEDNNNNNNKRKNIALKATNIEYME